MFFFQRTGLLQAHTFLNYLENETRLLLLSNIFTDEWNFLFSNYLTRTLMLSWKKNINIISFEPVGVLKWLYPRKALQLFSKYVWDRTTSLLYFIIVFLLPVAMAIRMKERPWNSQSLNRGGIRKIKEIACSIKNWVNNENWCDINL